MYTVTQLMQSKAWDLRNNMHVLLGYDMLNRVTTYDLTKMPHLLIGGSTGSGKSVLMHSMLCSLLYRNTSRQLRLMLIDPKRVELSIYKDLPHTLQCVSHIDDAHLALDVLGDVIEERYCIMEERRVRHVDNLPHSLPKIVLVVDELADLILMDKSIGIKLARIAAIGRAAGIHCIMGTQRPDASVLPGILRANLTARIALRVNKATESRIILDDKGAERLRGKGEFLARFVGMQLRGKSIYISDDELVQFVDKLKN